MALDQAAGLRRRHQARPQLCIHCVSESPASALRLAHALNLAGHAPLVVDAHDRFALTHAPHPLFDWQGQLERGQMFTLPHAGHTVWHAPGARADAVGLAHSAQAWDTLVFDSALVDAAVPMPGARDIAWVAVRADTMQATYALLKTRAAAGAASAILHGDAAACERVRAACGRFLGATVAAMVTCARNEDDAISALAVRMASEEPGLRPPYKTGNP